LVVVGIGIQWGGQTTLAARAAIAGAERVLFAVNDPWAARWIRQQNPTAEALPYPRDGRLRRDIYQQMVDRILAVLNEGRRTCAVFYGNPAVLTQPAHEAIRRARLGGFAARMLPGVSSIDCLFADLGVDPGNGCQIFEAGDFLSRRPCFDVHTGLILCQIGLIGNHGPYDDADEVERRDGLCRLGAHLETHYRHEHEAVIYEAATHPLRQPRCHRITIGGLVSAEVREVSTLYVPPLAPRHHERGNQVA
jgi:hypothetical protein